MKQPGCQVVCSSKWIGRPGRVVQTSGTNLCPGFSQRYIYTRGIFITLKCRWHPTELEKYLLLLWHPLERFNSPDSSLSESTQQLSNDGGWMQTATWKSNGDSRQKNIITSLPYSTLWFASNRSLQVVLQGSRLGWTLGQEQLQPQLQLQVEWLASVNCEVIMWKW